MKSPVRGESGGVEIFLIVFILKQDWYTVCNKREQLWIRMESHAREIEKNAVFPSEAIDLENLRIQKGWPFEESQTLTSD